MGTDRRDDHAFGLRIQNGPACGHRIRSRAGRRRNDHTIAPVMLHQNVIAVNAEINGLLQAAFCHDNVVQCMAFPAVMAQNMGVEQHPVVQLELAPRHGRQLAFHLADLAGSQKTAAAQVDAQDRLCMLERKIRLMQDRSVSADGQDYVRTFQTLFQRQIYNAGRIADRAQILAHQHRCTMILQDLRCTQSDLTGRDLSRVRRNVNRHAEASCFGSVSVSFSGPAWNGLQPRPVRRPHRPARRAPRSSARTSDIRCCLPDLSPG